MRALALHRQLIRRGLRADAAMLRRLVAIAFLLFSVADAIPLVRDGESASALFGWSPVDTVFDDGADALAAGDCTVSLVSPASRAACTVMQPAALGCVVSLAEVPRAPPLA